jgi:hypothetical protein
LALQRLLTLLIVGAGSVVCIQGRDVP